MNLKFIGAIKTVTGSCFHLTINDKQILVDCGMHQGPHSDEENRQEFDFEPYEIDYLILTHAHIDHSGLIPLLIKRGFEGKIVCTPATADLLLIMLKDSAHIQEKDAEWLNKQEMRAGREPIVQPLYTVEDVEDVARHLMLIQYDTIEHLSKEIRIRLVDAGHILGSASVELWYKDSQTEKKIVFSGDIGRVNNPIVRDPKTVNDADVVLIESTYGNRLHKDLESSIKEFVEVIHYTFKRGGNVFVPSFAVGRTQDILYILYKLEKEKSLPPHKVFVDSPLAEEATTVYLRHKECFDEEALEIFKKDKDIFRNFKFTTSVEASQEINKIKSGAIVIAGSGMCEGGRIRHHLKHNLWRKECSIVFSGYQVVGTLGRKIIDGAKLVKILGNEIAVKASVHTIGGFSAHADRDGLINWLKAINGNPLVYVVHGEETISEDFAKYISENLQMKAVVPEKGLIVNH
ncbi:MAG: MBL fold metallo-hydrolase [Thermodesulfovibrionales bacterium]|nr:MBL fold metallo-hydrolase [Thermodesulfovibrionales bacterium]